MPSRFFRARTLEESVTVFLYGFAWNFSLQGFRRWKEIFGVLYHDHHVDISSLTNLYGSKQS